MTRICVLSASLLAFLFVSCAGERSTPAIVNRAEFVGSRSCVECHAFEHESWQGSHHDLAMAEVTPETVIGEFDGREFSHAGITSTFSRSGDTYVMATDDAEGAIRDFVVGYTFGIDPLQQYLIEMSGGRVQASSLVWDARSSDDGGQRWYHLYENENVVHGDSLHWTAPLQNWNHMCAECHSTNVRKNYDPVNDRFDTTWSEIDVSCEACHGPGSKHVSWAKANAALRTTDAATEAGDMGLGVRLKDQDGGRWAINEDTGIPERSVPRTSHLLAESCARCHSRRGQFSEDYVYGKPLLDTHRLALLTEELYFADGQIYDEVYVYGSFLQSHMYEEGVTCTDCHDPHTLRLKQEGDNVCSTCHSPRIFSSPAHHHHEQGTEGASCVACHMPARTYMGVDVRHDHGFRVPRPDLTETIGAPNTCNDCHQDESARWAARQIEDWDVAGYDHDSHDDDSHDGPHYGETLHAGRRGLVGAGARLAAMASDEHQPDIVRATAISLLGANPSVEALPAIQRAMNDDSELVRLAAVEVADLIDPAQRAQLLLPLLRDPVRAVRMQAAFGLTAVPSDAIPELDRSAFRSALEEYRDAQWFNADRPDAHVNLGVLYTREGDLASAASSYREAIAKMPEVTAAYVNLADLQRSSGDERAAERTLREGLAEVSDSPDLRHSLGLSLVRQKHYDEAIEELRRAWELAPNNPRFGYVLGIALDSTGKRKEAIRVLETSLERRPGDADIRAALESIRGS